MAYRRCFFLNDLVQRILDDSLCSKFQKLRHNFAHLFFRQDSFDGKPVGIILKADRSELKADGKDLAFVTVSLVDKDGNECPDATNLLNFKLKGAGDYRAACNGDATSLQQFHLPVMKLFSGKLVVIVQSKEKAGDIVLRVSGKGLKSESLNIKAR